MYCRRHHSSSSIMSRSVKSVAKNVLAVSFSPSSTRNVTGVPALASRFRKRDSLDESDINALPKFPPRRLCRRPVIATRARDANQTSSAIDKAVLADVHRSLDDSAFTIPCNIAEVVNHAPLQPPVVFEVDEQFQFDRIPPLDLVE